MKGPLVVVGDALLDIDVVGTANRLTPDAPVPVLDDLEEHARPGGAALAALMAAREGHRVVLVTAIGADEAGSRLERLLDGVHIVRLEYDGSTPVKQRVRSGGQSLLRLDSGTAIGNFGPVGADVQAALNGAAAVLVCDYGRGVTALTDLRGLLEQLPANVPLVWDPHPRGSEPIPHAHLVTPNQAEAATMAQRHTEHIGTGTSTLATAAGYAMTLVAAWRARAVAVTLGSGGALLSYGEGAPAVSPAPPGPCLDSCGAGDRFAVAATLALAAGKLPTEAVAAAVQAASAYVAGGGPATLSGPAEPSPATSDLTRSSSETDTTAAQRLVEQIHARDGVVVAAGGCFDLLHAGHIATLEGARRLGDCLIVCLNSDASVRRLKGPGRPLVPAADRARVLLALHCVDAVVVFGADTPTEILAAVRPDIWVKGGDYCGTDVPEASVLEQWGGQVVTLSYLAGRSTTRLAATAAEASTVRPIRDTEEISS